MGNYLRVTCLEDPWVRRVPAQIRSSASSRPVSPRSGQVEPALSAFLAASSPSLEEDPRLSHGLRSVKT